MDTKPPVVLKLRSKNLGQGTCIILLWPKITILHYLMTKRDYKPDLNRGQTKLINDYLALNNWANLGGTLFHSKTCQHSILISYCNLVVSMQKKQHLTVC